MIFSVEVLFSKFFYREISNQPNSFTPVSSPVVVSGSKWSGTNVKVASGGVTVTTISPPKIQRPLSQGPLSLLNNSLGQVSLC